GHAVSAQQPEDSGRPHKQRLSGRPGCFREKQNTAKNLCKTGPSIDAENLIYKRKYDTIKVLF
ncbi:MAG: hypothetical protein RR320_06400, partial [Oscillospiraceae bacterium]